MNKQQRVTCCVSLRSRELQAPFLDPVITDSDEKWILYKNIKRKRQRLSRVSKPIPQSRQFGTAPECSKLAKFHEEGMRKFMARWEDEINKNGDYVEH
ncbi:hypothetical protein ACTXT7_001119 [Hymenolepis weldensis]